MFSDRHCSVWWLCILDIRFDIRAMDVVSTDWLWRARLGAGQLDSIGRLISFESCSVNIKCIRSSQYSVRQMYSR